jgi:hypothetical protein
MMACSAVFCAGVILEVINSHSLALFYTGRVICGLGIGGSATVIPIYMAEMSPKESRVRLGSCYQFTYTIGILVSYWIDYAVKFMTPSPAQWQIPIALQLVPGALMGLGTTTLPESVRWLLAKDEHARAHSSLLWIRASSPNSPALSAEFTDMRHGLEQERAATANFHPRELLAGPNARRLLLAFGLFLAQQSTGATALAYFAPQFFSLLVDPSDSDSESNPPPPPNRHLRRHKSTILSSLPPLPLRPLRPPPAPPLRRSSHVRLHARHRRSPQILPSSPRILIRKHYASSNRNHHPNLPRYHSLQFLLGPLPWPCVSELFPTRIREPGVAVGVGAQWAFNFVWSFSTPFILNKIKWATFLLFGGLDLLIVGFVWVCVLETRGKSLEEISALFEGDRSPLLSTRGSEGGCEAASDGDGDRGKDGSILHVEAGSASPSSLI